MANLKHRVQKAIDNTKHDNTPYTDNSDGFTHQTYSGLVEGVIEELELDGHDENVSKSIIEDYVFDMI